MPSYHMIRFRICCLFSVVSFQVQLFDFTHQRISGIGSGALVVKSLFHHLIQSSQEIFLFDSVFGDGLLDSDLFFQVFDRRDEFIQGILIVLACDTAEVRTLYIAGQSMSCLLYTSRCV